MKGKKYPLTDTQLLKIARLCVQEQGNIDGIRAEATLMANQLETSTYRQKTYGTGAAGLYAWVRNGGWFYRAAYYMDNGGASAAQIEAVRDVLVRGNRFFPQYVDEHDCLSDIKSISTGSVYTKGDYIKHKTIIKNRMGSTYTFYCFPAPGCDPFGYTAEAYKYVKEHGGDVPDPTPDPEPEDRVDVSCSLREIARGDTGGCVKIWQCIVGVEADGIFGAATEFATKGWQKRNDLAGDGIVGRRTWKKALDALS